MRDAHVGVYITITLQVVHCFDFIPFAPQHLLGIDFGFFVDSITPNQTNQSNTK